MKQKTCSLVVQNDLALRMTWYLQWGNNWINFFQIRQYVGVCFMFYQNALLVVSLQQQQNHLPKLAEC